MLRPLLEPSPAAELGVARSHTTRRFHIGFNCQVGRLAIVVLGCPRTGVGPPSAVSRGDNLYGGRM